MVHAIYAIILFRVYFTSLTSQSKSMIEYKVNGYFQVYPTKVFKTRGENLQRIPHGDIQKGILHQ